MPKTYSVQVTCSISGSVEVEANSEDEARDLAAGMTYLDWDEVNDNEYDTDDVEYLSDVCETCDEDVEDCECQYCEYCDRLVDDCDCEDEEEDEEEEEDE